MVFICSSFTESLGNNVFTVQVNVAANGVRTRTTIEVLDRHDGSYLVRYKLWQGYHGVVINVLYNGQHVAASPYALSGISIVCIFIVVKYAVCQKRLPAFLYVVRSFVIAGRGPAYSGPQR